MNKTCNNLKIYSNKSQDRNNSIEAQVDHDDGQERAPSGPLGYGDSGRHAQTRGAQAQHASHGLRGQGGRDQKGASLAA